MDVLLYLLPGQARTGVADFYVALYADDGSAAHAPGQQIGSPWSLSNATGAFSAAHATWLQVDVSGAGWPALSQAAYYWVGLLPGAPLPLSTSSNAQYDGALWCGASDESGALPADLTSGGLFTARQLVSQRFGNDRTFGSAQAASVSFLQGASGWASVTFAASRFLDWAAAGSHVRYGLQVVGVPVLPPCEWGALQASLRFNHTLDASPSPPCSPVDVCLFDGLCQRIRLSLGQWIRDGHWGRTSQQPVPEPYSRQR